MRTLTKTVNLYKFDELSEEAQQQAIENLSTINVDFDWWTSDYEDAARVGLKITSFDLDRNRHAKGHFTLSAAEVAANILKEHGEECETYKTATNFLEDHNPIFAEYLDENSDKYESREAEEELQDIEDEFLKSLIEDYSIILQKQYEYLTSAEAIKETIESNEYEFTEDGKLY